MQPTQEQIDKFKSEHSKIRSYNLNYKGEKMTFLFRVPDRNTIYFATRQLVNNKSMLKYNETIVKNTILFGYEIYTSKKHKSIYNELNNKVSDIITDYELTLIDYSEVPKDLEKKYEDKFPDDELNFFNLQKKESTGKDKPQVLVFKVPEPETVEEATKKLIDKNVTGYQTVILENSLVSDKKVLKDDEKYFAIVNGIETILNGGVEAVKKS